MKIPGQFSVTINTHDLDDRLIEVDVPLSDLGSVMNTEFDVMTLWLAEFLAKPLSSTLVTKAYRVIDENLIELGSLSTGGEIVPVFLARGLWNIKTLSDHEIVLKQKAGRGIVLNAGSESPRFIGEKVVIPVMDVLSSDTQDFGLDVAKVLHQFATEGARLSQPVKAQVICTGDYFGNLVMPGKDALVLSGRIQINFFQKLADAYNDGIPGVHSSVLREGSSARSPQEVFTGKMRAKVFQHYVEPTGVKGFWRLKG